MLIYRKFYHYSNIGFVFNSLFSIKSFSSSSQCIICLAVSGKKGQFGLNCTEWLEWQLPIQIFFITILSMKSWLSHTFPLSYHFSDHEVFFYFILWRRRVSEIHPYKHLNFSISEFTAHFLHFPRNHSHDVPLLSFWYLFAISLM